MRQGSTEWYREQSRKLVEILHETKYEFDPVYRFQCDKIEEFRKDLNKMFWAGGEDSIKYIMISSGSKFQ